MRKIIIEIDKKDAEYLERLNFELGFAKDVIQRILESHSNDPEMIKSKAFAAYQKKGAELEAEYKTASASLEQKYIPEKLRGHKCSWILPLDSNQMEITIHCNCKIEGIKDEESRTVQR